MPDEVLYDVKGGVARLRLNRPDRLNALNTPTLTALWKHIGAAEADDAVRVIVISGEGRAFSAGADISALVDEPPIDADRYFMERGSDPFIAARARSLELWDQFWEVPKPIITQVHGYCLAAGCEAAFYSDYTIASEDARFGEPESKNGWCPASLWLLGPKRAREVFLLGGMLTAQEAFEAGLVNRVVPRDQLEAATEEAIQKLLAIPSASLAAVKRTGTRFYKAMGFSSALQAAGEMSVYVRALQGLRDDEIGFHRLTREEGLKSALRARDGDAGAV